MRGIVVFILTLGFISCASTPHNQPLPYEAGTVFIASAEGISVFDRKGQMLFGHFKTSFDDETPAALDWDDMVYDGWPLANGNYLYSSQRYVRELSPNGTLLWDYRLPAPNELKTCLPLPNGDVVTVDADKMELVRITNQGRKELERIPAKTTPEASIHSRYNLLRRTPSGTYLLALRHENAFIEIDASGNELWRHAVPELPIVAKRLPNGNTLMSWQGGIIEVSPDNTVVWELTKDDITDFSIQIFAGFHRFENGNTLIANSDWHYKEAGENRIQLFEVNQNKEVLWTMTTDEFKGQKPGSLEPTTGLTEHRIIGIQWIPN